MISEKINKESSFLSGLEPWNLDGGGVCFLNCLAPFVGMTVPELYILSHTHMRVLVRDSELLYGYLCDFELFGLFQRYCDMVGYGI